MTDSVISDSTYLMIGARRQFFFDDLLLEQTQNLTRRYYSPQKVPASPVLRKDQPWENTLYFTCNTWNVIHDPRDGLFKCWYEDWMIDDLSNYVCWTDETTGKLCVNFHRRWPTRYLYAESRDGLTWDKPALEYLTEDGRKTNVVLGSPETGMVHAAYVLLDPLEQDEARRFKMLFEHRGLEGGDDIGSGLFCLATSGEGIHWTIGDQPVEYGQCGSIAGDVVTVSVDCDSRTYLVNNRHPRMCSIVPRDTRNPADSGWVSPSFPDDMFRQTKRRVFRSESTDLIHLSTPTPLISPDADLDNIDDEFYGMEQFQIGDDWLGLLNVFHNTDNTMDVQLAYSRNGRDFQRFRPGHPWLPLGPAESWDQGMVTICSKPIVVGDELWVFYGGTKNQHDWWMVGLPEGLEVAESSGNLDEVE